MRLAPWYRFKSSSNFFYWPFWGGTSFVDHWCFCVLSFSCFCVCSLLPCGHLLGRGWTLGSCWRCLLYFCYFPKWYPGSGVVLDCIVSWSLPSFLLLWSLPFLIHQTVLITSILYSGFYLAITSLFSSSNCVGSLLYSAFHFMTTSLFNSSNCVLV